MHVALTVNYSPWSAYSGGAQRSTHNLACALARSGHRVDVVYTRGAWEQVHPPKDLPYQVHWAKLAAMRSRASSWLRPLSSFSVAAELQKLGADVVHANGEEAAVAAGHREVFDGPFVVTPRYPSFPASMNDGSWRRPGARLRHMILHGKYAALGYALAGADRYCPTSRDSASRLRRVFGLRPKRIRVVPNGVERVFFEHQWQQPSSEQLLYFGRFAEEKGVLDLVEALGRLPDPPPAVFVGRGPALAQMRARIEELGLTSRVTIRDWVSGPALCELIATSSQVVLPSWEESFGNAIAEAMAVGAPIVTTNRGSIPELVSQEKTALITFAQAPEGLARAIERLRVDPTLAASLAEAARHEAETRFSWDRVAASYADVYREIPA
ncbi:MAG: glycosyltransferase family 4 protein [Nannocystaceae bacterium]|nr:glycosyltransferase family 4 protein [Nannocystaceae bacterium]